MVALTSMKKKGPPRSTYGSTAGVPITPGVGTANPEFAPSFVQAVAAPFGMDTP